VTGPFEGDNAGALGQCGLTASGFFSTCPRGAQVSPSLVYHIAPGHDGAGLFTASESLAPRSWTLASGQAQPASANVAYMGLADTEVLGKLLGAGTHAEVFTRLLAWSILVTVFNGLSIC
jgi:hypothetical protein